ncbi:T9SS type A sorting domain-containing protein [Flavobacteriaceae bacterium SZ-1-7]|uniref:T9SS type A sorting domain-containing protein n=1 Tax=Tamlana sedimenti TaxID=3134126 RepID=UPI00312073E7
MKSFKLNALLFFFATGVFAQQATLTSGGTGVGTGGSSNYTVGQILYTSQTGTNGNKISEGVQQPYEISTVLSVAEAKGISLEFLAYPNPTSSNLIVKVENYTNQNLQYQIYNVNGSLLQTIEANGVRESIINMESYPKAVYFLKVIEGKKEIKVFKIIKK